MYFQCWYWWYIREEEFETRLQCYYAVILVPFFTSIRQKNLPFEVPFQLHRTYY